MAIIRQNRLWNGIQTRLEIDNETGTIEVYSKGGGFFGVDVLLATSNGKGSDWKINNPQSLTNIFNNVNNTQSTVKEVERAFFLEGYKVFDNDRAFILNSASSYDSQDEFLTSIQRFYNQRTPLIKDPNTSRKVNSDGNQTTEPIDPNQTSNTINITSSDAPPVVYGADVTEVSESPEEQTTSTSTSRSFSRAVPTASTRSSGTGILRYPLADLSLAANFGVSYDYIKIGITEYVPSLGSGSINSVGAVDRYVKSSSETIILPMVAGLSSQNGIGWGNDSMNAVQLALGETIASSLKAVGDEGFNFATIKTQVGNAMDRAQNLANAAVKDKDIIAGLLAGYVMGNSSVATRSTGAVLNPNLELLFNGPQLRSFQFNFNFAPRSGAEAEVVAKIIKTLKKSSAPKIEKNGSIFLKTPDVFQLQYIYNGNGSADGGDHPYLNKIKPCALTSIGVNYTPGGTYMTYQGDGQGGGSMTQTMLSLTFTELEPIYDIDYDDNHLTGY